MDFDRTLICRQTKSRSSKGEDCIDDFYVYKTAKHTCASAGLQSIQFINWGRGWILIRPKIDVNIKVPDEPDRPLIKCRFKIEPRDNIEVQLETKLGTVKLIWNRRRFLDKFFGHIALRKKFSQIQVNFMPNQPSYRFQIELKSILNMSVRSGLKKSRFSSWYVDLMLI